MVVLSKQKLSSSITVSPRPSSNHLDLQLSRVSCMPLHLSLGLGKQALEIVEKEAIVLDNTIKEANGEACPQLTEAFERRETLNIECFQHHQQLEEINEAI